MISVKNSYEIAYNGTENECRFELCADTAADLQGLTHIDGIKIQMGSECTDIATGDKYLLNGSGAWILQPSDRAFSNVYTKAEIDAMIANYYTKTEADAIFDWITFTITTDTLPLSFISDGTPLTSVTIKGNGQQNGTPSPQNIVPFDGTGERTANLFDKSKQGGQIYITESVTQFGVEIPVAAGTYTISGGTKTLFVKEKIGDTYYTALDTSRTRTYTLSQDGYILIYAAKESDYEVDNLMLVSGSTAPTSYIPYGWQIPLTCAGQTTPLYLGEVSTTRRVRKLVLTGEESVTQYTGYGAQNCFFVSKSGASSSIGLCDTYVNVSNLSSWINTDNSFMVSDSTIRIHDGRFSTPSDIKSYLADQYTAGTPVTVWYVLATPTTGIVNEPLAKIGDYADELHSEDAGVSIPTAKGSNTLSADTTVQPSEVSITGGIRNE